MCKLKSFLVMNNISTIASRSTSEKWNKFPDKLGISSLDTKQNVLSPLKD